MFSAVDHRAPEFVESPRKAEATGLCRSLDLAESVGERDRGVVFGQLFLGDDLLPWLLLAFGSALAVGHLMAYIKPPVGDDGTVRPRPALARVVAMVIVGSLVAGWAAVSLAG